MRWARLVLIDADNVLRAEELVRDINCQNEGRSGAVA